MDKAQLYLVPVDFTPVSITSTKFALDLAKRKNDHICLLHIVKTENEKTAAELLLEDFARKHLAEYSRYTTKVIIGKVNTDIAIVAESMEAAMIILGTHGATGLTKLFGSYAFKIVEHSKVPLIIVQEATLFHDIKKIVMTIDLEKESLQIVRNAASISKMFNSEIILVGINHTDELFKRKIELNINVCRSFLIENGIKHTIELLDGNGFIHNIFKLCKERNADLLAATYYQTSFHVFTDTFVQSLSKNELHMPVLTIDSENTVLGGQYGFLSV